MTQVETIARAMQRLVEWADRENREFVPVHKEEIEILLAYLGEQQREFGALLAENVRLERLLKERGAADKDTFFG